MPRYIDADALKELIDGGFDIDFDEVPETKNALLHMIDYQETADMVEVVRCKDCKHRKGAFHTTRRRKRMSKPTMGNLFSGMGGERR